MTNCLNFFKWNCLEVNFTAAVGSRRWSKKQRKFINCLFGLRIVFFGQVEPGACKQIGEKSSSQAQAGSLAPGYGEAQMSDRTVWLEQGERLGPSEAAQLAELREDDVLQRRGLVAIQTSHEKGTVVRWSFFAPNWASLYYVMETLYLYPAPYHLHFFLAGWFRETYQDFESARRRIHELVAKSDIHILSRTFVHNARPSSQGTPPLLQDAISDLTVNPEFSVDCAADEQHGRYYVERIGSRSCLPASSAFRRFPIRA